MKKILPWAAWVVALLVAVVLGIKSLREPDLWWIFLTGEWITFHGKVPTTDVFSYTHQGVPWINVKWLFEVIAFWVQRIGGPEFVFILQCIVNALLVVFLWKLYKSLRGGVGLPKVSAPTIGVLLVTLAALFACNFRMIGRPEMTSHILTIVFIAIFMRHRVKGGKGIWWLVPLMVFWTNMHEAYGTGLVIIVVMVVGAVLDWWALNKQWGKGDEPFPKWATLAGLGGVLAISLNPRGPKMILHPFEIFSQVGENKFTSELFSWETSYYWKQEEPYIMLVMAAIVLLGFFMKPVELKVKQWWLRPVQSYGTGYAGLCLLFLYLGFTAHRNIPFFILVSAPMVMLTLDRLGRKFAEKESVKVAGYVTMLVAGVFFYISTVNGSFYEKFAERDSYGLYVDGIKNPVGATRFIKENNIQGRCFGDFLTSAYMMWNLRPEYKSYIDLRDLDIYTAEFFNAFTTMMYYPQQFEAEDDKYEFDYIVLYRIEFPQFHKYLNDHPDWELVFVDPVAAIFLKRNDRNNELIEQYGGKDMFQPHAPPQPGGLANGLAKLFNPGYEPLGEPVNTDAIAASYFKGLGKYQWAAERAVKAQVSPVQLELGYELFGFIEMEWGDQESDPALKQQRYGAAWEAFNAYNQFKPDGTAGYKGLAMLQLRSGDPSNASSQLLQAQRIDPTDKEVLILLAECQRQLSFSDQPNAAMHTAQWQSYMEQALVLDPADLTLKIKLGMLHCQRNECDMVQEYLSGIPDYPGLTKQDKQVLKDCRSKCNVVD